MRESNYHAKRSPSGAHRWANCPGAPAMEHGEPNTSTEYSDEGTAAHWLAARCLVADSWPGDYLGAAIDVIDGVARESKAPRLPLSHEGLRRFEVTGEFASFVDRYVQAVREAAIGAMIVGYELDVPIDHVTGEDGATGAADAGILTATGGMLELQAHDLKFGMGNRIDAKDNEQGILYLLGLRALWAGKSTTVPTQFRFVIHQPRLNHTSEWVYTAEDLDQHARRLAQAAEATQRAEATQPQLTLTEELSWGKTYLRPAPKTCQWCKAKHKCPALAEYVTEAVGVEMADLTKGRPLPAIPADAAVLGDKLRAVDLIGEWCKAVMARAEAVLLEQANSQEIIKAMGFKLVAGKRGNRAWFDADGIEKYLKSKKVPIADMYDMKLISPTTAEKRFKGPHPRYWRELEPGIVQPDGKPHVASAGDKREALNLTPAAPMQNLDVPAGHGDMF